MPLVPEVVDFLIRNSQISALCSLVRTERKSFTIAYKIELGEFRQRIFHKCKYYNSKTNGTIVNKNVKYAATNPYKLNFVSKIHRSKVIL